MRLGDLLALAWEALRAHRLRTRMTYAAIAIGFGAVLLLTALGEGGRQWVIGRFAFLGTSTLVVFPGRTETRGVHFRSDHPERDDAGWRHHQDLRLADLAPPEGAD